jgi:hypothetical protein
MLSSFVLVGSLTSLCTVGAYYRVYVCTRTGKCYYTGMADKLLLRYL